MADLNFEDNDDFSRKDIARKVIDLLISPTEVSPLVIDGGWGTGKTIFCRKMITLFEEICAKENGGTEPYDLIYIDAFRADHTNNPLLTVLVEILKQEPDETTKSKLSKAIVPVLRLGLNVTAKAGVSWLLKQDSDKIAEGFEEAIQTTADKAIDVSVGSILKDHEEADKNLEALQKILKEKAKTKPIILFIDELDRCRPDFAVNMLETLKHTFDIEGVQFVLITNTCQLRASISHCYGGVDEQRYLDKFLKFTFTLPNRFNVGQFEGTQVAIHHYEKLIKKSETLEHSVLCADNVQNFFEHIHKENHFSLREIETLVRHLEICHILSTKEQFVKGSSVGLICLRLLGVIWSCFKPNLTNSILNNEMNTKLIGKFFGYQKISQMDVNDKARMDYHAVLLLLVDACKLNEGEFKLASAPGTDSTKKWMEIKKNYFASNRSQDPSSRVVDEITRTISILNLN